jgi:serine/threonine-protein kinase
VVDDVVADRYDLEQLVGTGGMSSVYKARDRLLERSVALKILHEHHSADEEFVERFRREARAVAQLSHPNIVTVIDRGEDGGKQFIVFEYVDGQNLKELVEETGPLPAGRAIELALQVARGLAFAHQHGLVHRDVKPQNVLMNGDGQAKVTDFGIARSLDVDGVTQTGTVLGTSNYIAPEQASGQAVTARTDVYSLGVVLYELLTGEVPFPGDNFVAVAMKHINAPAPSVLEKRPDVPLRLAAVVERALEKNPADRFQSMDELIAELQACLAELPREADSDATMIVPPPARRAPARPARPRPSRLPLLLALGLAVLAAAALAAFLLVRSRAGNRPSAAAPATARVHLKGVTAYDPQVGDGEHNDAAVNATDGNPTTYWYTEHYRSFDKKGVGLVLDAGRPAHVTALTVVTDTPGYTAQIQAGSSPDGGFHPVSGSQTVSHSTRFTLTSGPAARYYLLWITKLQPGSDVSAHVNEVRAG